MLLLEVAKAFHKEKIKFIVVGGYAVALHGAVRGTVDIDIVLSLSEESFTRAEKILNKLSLYSRLPVKAAEVFNFRKEYAANRNMLAWSFVDASNPLRQLDILILEDANKLNEVVKVIHGVKVPILSLDDLIKMKKKAARAQDLEDVKALELIKAGAYD